MPVAPEVGVIEAEMIRPICFLINYFENPAFPGSAGQAR
jgi:hypothetical protein